MAITSTDLLTEGMELNTAVKNHQGQILFAAGLVLKEKHINMMQAWGIGEADVKLDEKEESEVARRLKEAIAKHEDELKPRFFRCDLLHPVVSEIIRICAERLAEKQSRKEV